MEGKSTAIPFVYWAQSQDELFLRVEMEAKSAPQLDTSAKEIHFSCDGTAPGKGLRRYEFHLDLHEEVEPGAAGYRMQVLGSKIQLFIKKAPQARQFWPQLINSKAKPAWLKIDFDRFESGDADSEDEKPDGNRDLSMKQSVDELLSGLKDKQPGDFRRPEVNFKNMYLTVFNSFLLITFAGIFLNLMRNYIHYGSEFYPNTFSMVGTNLRIAQYFQALEVLHAAVRFVHSSPLAAALQTVGRLAVLHIIYFETELQSMPAVFWLFLTWSAVEIIRYPYYICQIHSFVPWLLKYARYTSWIVLYPLGMTLELVIMLQAVEKYYVNYPKPLLQIAGYQIGWAHVIAAYACLFPVACIVLLRYMFKQTKQQLFGKKKSLVKNKKIN